MISLWSMDWLKAKFQGKLHISWANLWFPVGFPSKQSIESCFFIWLTYIITKVYYPAKFIFVQQYFDTGSWRSVVFHPNWEAPSQSGIAQPSLKPLLFEGVMWNKMVYLPSLRLWKFLLHHASKVGISWLHASLLSPVTAVIKITCGLFTVRRHDPSSEVHPWREAIRSLDLKQPPTPGRSRFICHVRPTPWFKPMVQASEARSTRSLSVMAMYPRKRLRIIQCHETWLAISMGTSSINGNCQVPFLAHWKANPKTYIHVYVYIYIYLYKNHYINYSYHNIREYSHHHVYIYILCIYVYDIEKYVYIYINIMYTLKTWMQNAPSGKKKQRNLLIQWALPASPWLLMLQTTGESISVVT